MVLPNVPRAVAWAFAVGLALRSSLLFWGVVLLPHEGPYHPDEPSSYMHAARFPGNVLDNRAFVHGTTVPYVVALPLLPFRPFTSTGQYQFLCQMSLRLVSLALGAGSVLLLFAYARGVLGERAATSAAWLLAVSPAHVLLSALATQDVMMSGVLLVFLLFLRRACAGAAARDFALAGVALGVLVGMKVSGLLFAPLVAVSLWESRHVGGRRTPQDLLRCATVLLGTALGVFLATNPHVLLAWPDFVHHWQEQKRVWFDRTWIPAAELPMRAFKATRLALTAPVALLGLIGASLLPLRHKRAGLVLLALLVLYYAAFRHYLQVRFLATIAPVLCLAAAAALQATLGDRRNWSTRLGLVAVCVFCLQDALTGIAVRLDDPRTRAARFLAREAAPGTSCARLPAPGAALAWEWEYPYLPPLSLTPLPVEASPDLVLVSAPTEHAMRRALGWPTRASEWMHFHPPSAEQLRIAAAVLGDTGPYELWASFEPRLPPRGNIRGETAYDFGGVGVKVYRRRRGLPPG